MYVYSIYSFGAQISHIASVGETEVCSGIENRE